MQSVSAPDVRTDVDHAREALSRGDLVAAVRSLGVALVEAPTSPPLLTLLDTTIRQTQDPLSLSPITGDDGTVPAAVTHAYTLGCLGRHAEAMALVAKIVAARPHVPILAWCVWWAQHPAVVARLTPADLMAVLSPLAKALPVLEGERDPRRANVEHAAQLCGLLRKAHRLPFLLYVSSLAARRLGQFSEALSYASEAYELEPSYLSATSVAAVYKDFGEVDAAIRAFRSVLPYATDGGVSVFVDLGDLLLSATRYSEAAEAYSRALEIDPGHGWARPSYLFARYKSTGAESDRAALLAFRRDTPDNARAGILSSQVAQESGAVPKAPSMAPASRTGTLPPPPGAPVVLSRTPTLPPVETLAALQQGQAGQPRPKEPPTTPNLDATAPLRGADTQTGAHATLGPESTTIPGARVDGAGALLYEYELPPIVDPLARAIDEIIEQFRSGRTLPPSVTITSEWVEAPSIGLAYELARRKWAGLPALDIAVASVQSPDPRVPRGHVELKLWSYDGTTPRAEGGPPDPRLSDAIVQIARSPYSLSQWEAQAEALAGQLGASWASQIAFAMVHPTEPPVSLDSVFEWLFRTQLAAALVLSRVDQGWEGSTRKRALYTLALGPLDWSAAVAVLALGRIARTSPPARKDVEQLFMWLGAQVSKTAFSCVELPLVHSWQSLEGLDEGTKQRLSGWRADIDARNARVSLAVRRSTKPTSVSDVPPADTRPSRPPQALTNGTGGRGEAQGALSEPVVEGLGLERYAAFCTERDAILSRYGGGHTTAMLGVGAWPEIETLLRKFGLSPRIAPGMGTNAQAARIPEWEARLDRDAVVRERFAAIMSRMADEARASGEGGPYSHPRVPTGAVPAPRASEPRFEALPVSSARQELDDDPIVFPGQRIARLSDYVGLMRMIQHGDMMGALSAHGIDFAQYGAIAQAWGHRLATDPALNARFGRLMGMSATP